MNTPSIQNCRLEILTGIEGIDSLREAWERLYSQLKDPSHFQLWAWHRSRVAHMESEPANEHFAAFYDGPDVVAIIPLREGSLRLSIFTLRALSLPSNEHMIQSDVLVHPDWLARINASSLMDRLREVGLRFDLLLLGPTIQGSDSATIFAARTPRFTVSCPAGQNSFAIPVLPKEETLRRLSKNFRSNLRKMHNRVERLGALRVETARTVEQLLPDFQLFLELEASGWKGQTGTSTAIATLPGVKAFYLEVVEHAARSGHVEINNLYAGENIIASQLVFNCGSRCYVHKIGNNETYAQLSPGHLMVELLLERYEGQTALKYVDMVSDATWLNSWKPETRLVTNHYVFRPTFWGVLVWAAFRLKQALATTRATPLAEALT